MVTGTVGVVEDTSTGSGVGLDQEILVIFEAEAFEWLEGLFLVLVLGPHLVFES